MLVISGTGDQSPGPQAIGTGRAVTPAIGFIVIGVGATVQKFAVGTGGEVKVFQLAAEVNIGWISPDICQGCFVNITQVKGEYFLSASVDITVVGVHQCVTGGHLAPVGDGSSLVLGKFA